MSYRNWSVRQVFYFCLFFSLMGVSCSSPTEEVQLGYGRLSVSLAQDDVPAVSRALESLDPNDSEASAYVVSLYNASDELLSSETYDRFGTQTLPFGDYYATAENCTEAEAEEGNGCMRLFGRSASVEISQENPVQTLSVNCEVRNAMFTVAFSEEAMSNIDALQVVLTNNPHGRTITVQEAAAETVCWFHPCTVAYTITGSYRGKSLSMEGSIALQAKDNVKLHVKINLEKGELFAPEVNFQQTIDSESNLQDGFNPYE